jgi:hypothetical protein
VSGSPHTGREAEDLRIVAAKSTLTAVTITTVTTTMPYTCITAIEATVNCRRRKKKNLSSLMHVTE